MSRIPDVGRLSKALERPGIDPRQWVCLAEIVLVKFDAAEGVFADILLLPNKEQETARVSAIYAGAGFGLYAPLLPGDEVVVIAPDGDPNAGLVVVARLWSKSDPPPTAAQDPTSPTDPSPDVVLVAKSDVNIRIITLGTGNVVLDPQGTGKVGVGGDPGGAGMEPMVLGQALSTYLGPSVPIVPGIIPVLVDWLVAITPFITALGFTGGLPPAPPNFLTQKGEVK